MATEPRIFDPATKDDVVALVKTWIKSNPTRITVQANGDGTYKVTVELP
jgi:hypothetical protein